MVEGEKKGKEPYCCYSAKMHNYYPTYSRKIKNKLRNPSKTRFIDMKEVDNKLDGGVKEDWLMANWLFNNKESNLHFKYFILCYFINIFNE